MNKENEIYDKIMSVLNSYQTTNMVYLKQVHGNKTLMIDPMDFHKIANELTKEILLMLFMAEHKLGANDMINDI